MVSVISHFWQFFQAADSIENCTDPDSPVECLIGFVGETTIQSIKRATDDTISSWYYSVSTITDHIIETTTVVLINNKPR
jgi:hypothetical protein